MWVYIPFYCAENILTDLLRKNGFDSLGFMLLGVLYLFQMLSSFFAPSVCHLIGLKWSFIVGGMTLSAFVLIQILPAWRKVQQDSGEKPTDVQSFFERQTVCVCFLYLANIITGSGTGPMWTAQGDFMTLCSTENSVGFYFSIFWTFYMFSQIFGNLVGALIITRTSGPMFFLILGIIMVSGTLMFLFVRPPKKSCQILDENGDVVTEA